MIFFLWHYIINDLTKERIKRMYLHNYLKVWQYKALLKRGGFWSYSFYVDLARKNKK